MHRHDILGASPVYEMPLRTAPLSGTNTTATLDLVGIKREPAHGTGTEEDHILQTWGAVWRGTSLVAMFRPGWGPFSPRTTRVPVVVMSWNDWRQTSSEPP